MEEEWRKTSIIDDCYEVSNLGRIRSVKTKERPSVWGRVLSPIINPDGYQRITIENAEGEKGSFFIHVLVADAFLGPSNSREVNHKHGVGEGDGVDNLEYTDRKGNAEHAKYFGLMAKHERRASKLTKNKVLEIREKYINGIPVREIAEEYEISKVWTYKIINEEVWIGA